MHEEETTIAFAKNAKNSVFSPKYEFLGYLALFWMTSA